MWDCPNLLHFINFFCFARGHGAKDSAIAKVEITLNHPYNTEKMTHIPFKDKEDD